MRKNYVAAAVCAALSISAAYAQTPALSDPSNLDQAVRTVQQAQAQIDEQKAPAPAVDANTQLLTAIHVTQIQQLQTLQAIQAGLIAQAHPAQ
ncbi:hypothetical protein [Paraburkholderia susongensis]|uniref:Uncharacterized protein n=1 Tax=Paraburkholderia susongensis TaxID=1515439 RepID=A0A1X7M617_9BURK|nr:hypothetical protein [Paraburkholderia susongensis]SMG61545.1 hypothetical protein SAMN06265784_12315 [Paraburkholderia susongensis]